MVDTKLILLEGLPCSGKTTLSRHLESTLVSNGYTAKSHDESYEDHPVIINYDGIYSENEGERYLGQWQEFVARKLRSDFIDLIDNRFWINIGAYVIYSGLPAEHFKQINSRTIEILKPLKPALIYFRHTSTDDGMRRAKSVRGEEWLDRLLKRDLTSPWYQERGAKEFEGYLEFWKYWGELIDYLWKECPFRKLELIDAYNDWDESYQRVRKFLGI